MRPKGDHVRPKGDHMNRVYNEAKGRSCEQGI